MKRKENIAIITHANIFIFVGPCSLFSTDSHNLFQHGKYQGVSIIPLTWFPNHFHNWIKIPQGAPDYKLQGKTSSLMEHTESRLLSSFSIEAFSRNWNGNF